MFMLKKKWIVLIVLFGLLTACDTEIEGNTVSLETAMPEQTAAANEGILPTAVDTAEPDPSTVHACLSGLRGVEAKVLEVIDGDTITVSINGAHAKVRYLGIDAPEMGASDPAPGQDALDVNQAMVGDQTVFLYQGDTDRDEYGRLLRFVVADGFFVNMELVTRGNAVSFNRPHDALCAKEFDTEMYDAFKANRGIWFAIRTSYLPTVDPVCPDGCEKHVEGCDIKGNISQKGDYIFHLPGSADYSSTSISSGKGERWFCTIDEAVANGFRPPRSE